jgi:uncharacterized protein YjbI with pentapeptide repeats
VHLPDPPDLPAQLHELKLDREAAADGESWSAVSVVDTALPGVDARALGFVEARLEAADVSGARLANLFLGDCELLRCDLSNATVRNGSMRRVTVDSGRLTGLAWTAGVIRDATFRDCRADMASFEGTRLERVVFEGCNLREADFRQARFESVSFAGCDLTGADIGNAGFQQCSISGCDLAALRGVDRLRGVAMPWADIVAAAGVFAAELGIRVLDD